MISHLTGTIAEKTMSSAVIDVNGVGYEVGISANTSAALPAPGDAQVTRVYTRMSVREDAVSLWGFGSREERVCFDRLVNVSGVGPKLALAVLGTFTPEALRQVIASGDEKRMSTVPGVGKKTAQRMLLELKDAFKGELPSADLWNPDAGAEPAQADARAALEVALQGLMSMGLSPAEAELALKGYDGDPSDTAAAVKYALKRMGAGK